MDGQKSYNVIDEDVLFELKRYPFRDLVRMLFPSHNLGSRGCMCSPFREDRKPSFSYYIGRGEVPMWKDHATGDHGDNIEFYRKAFPGLTYLEAVDGLSRLVLGRSALRERTESDSRSYARVKSRPAVDDSVPKVLKSDIQSASHIVSSVPVSDSSVPQDCRIYWRNRAISDKVMRLMGARYVVYQSDSLKGKPMVDPVSMLPIVIDGKQLIDDGIRNGIGLKNDIGDYVVREPDTEYHKGFKGNVGNQFVSTFLSDSRRPAESVAYVGSGSNAVSSPYYDAGNRFFYINRFQGFSGVDQAAAPFVCGFMSKYAGKTLDERDVRCIVAVLDSLNMPVSSKVVVIEGMFDGFSFAELNHIRRNKENGQDMVVLNSVTNAHWAVPFLCRHQQVNLMLDNDFGSQAGQKTSKLLREQIALFSSSIGIHVNVNDASSLYSGYKDLNEALMAEKGFPKGYRPVSTIRKTEGRSM